MLFIEGKPDSLDQPLYELLFPGISIFSKETCGDVERSVRSIRESRGLAWVQAFGIVDQDQLTEDRKTELEAQGIFSLSVYSVEALYYGPLIVGAMAHRQCAVSGSKQVDLVNAAKVALLAKVSTHADRLAARMTEQTVKDQISLRMPDWKKILSGQKVNISCDTSKLYRVERGQLDRWITQGEIEKIVARYPVRETGAIDAIAAALQFKSTTLYEASVRRMVSEDKKIRAHLLSHFGQLPAMLK